MKTKKFNEVKVVEEPAQVDLNLLLTGMLFLAVAGIAGAYSLQIESDVQRGFTTNSLEYNATEDAKNGIANVTGQFDLIGTILVAVVILGLIFMLFQFVRT